MAGGYVLSRGWRRKFRSVFVLGSSPDSGWSWPVSVGAGSSACEATDAASSGRRSDSSMVVQPLAPVGRRLPWKRSYRVSTCRAVPVRVTHGNRVSMVIEAQSTPAQSARDKSFAHVSPAGDTTLSAPALTLLGVGRVARWCPGWRATRVAADRVSSSSGYRPSRAHQPGHRLAPDRDAVPAGGSASGDHPGGSIVVAAGGRDR